MALNTHDVSNEELAAVAFPAEISLKSYKFFWVYKNFKIGADFAYWWREFDRAALDQWMLFETHEYCEAFKKVSDKFNIPPEQCLVVPPKLRAHWAKNNLAFVVTDFMHDDARLSHLAAHYSEPETT